jgi:hypothetical protein
LVVDTALETSWAPIDELDGSLGLDGGNGRVYILGDNVTSVHQAASHVLSVTGIALGHHVGWLKHGVGELRNGQLLVVGLLSRDDWGVRSQHKVNSWVWHKIGLELGDIDVQSTIESERSSQRGHDLGNQSVQVGVGWALNVQVAATHIIQGLVIQAESAVSVLKERVG